MFEEGFALVRNSPASGPAELVGFGPVPDLSQTRGRSPVCLERLLRN